MLGFIVFTLSAAFLVCFGEVKELTTGSKTKQVLESFKFSVICFYYGSVLGQQSIKIHKSANEIYSKSTPQNQVLRWASMDSV